MQSNIPPSSPSPKNRASFQPGDPRTPRSAENLSKKFLLGYSSFKAKAVADEVVPKDDEATFCYRFSPGRGPFNGKRANINTPHDDFEKDITRTKIEPDEGDFSQYLLGLRTQLTGYLNTQKGGVLSEAHGAAERFPPLGEPFEVNGNSRSTGELGRVYATVSVKDVTSLRVSSHITVADFWWSKRSINNLLMSHNDYELFLDPQKQDDDIDKGKALVHRFLTTKVKMTFSHTVSDVRNEADVYNWRRRMDSFIAEVSNIDNIETLDLTMLANQYSNRVAAPVARDAIEDKDNSRERESSFETVQSGEESKEPARASLLSLPVFKKTLPQPPRYTDKDPSFQKFATMDSLKQQLILEVSTCQGRFTGGLNKFESSTITVSLRMAQYANKTLQNIQADLFLRRVRLTFIKACLEQPMAMVGDVNKNIFERDENKIGLCETLLEDLEHPLLEPNEEDPEIASILEEVRGFSSVVKKMRDKEIQFQISIFKGVVDNLMRQANIKTRKLKDFCKRARENSPQEVWRTTKQLLNETSLVPQLRALSKPMCSDSLREFSDNCSIHFSSNESTKADLKEISEKKIVMKERCAIIDRIRALVLQISSNEDLHRLDFLAPITQTELDAAENFDPFLIYTIDKVLVPRQELIEHLKQVADLNAYYTLLEICKLWGEDLRKELESAIVKLKLPGHKDSNFKNKERKECKEKIKALILSLPEQYQKSLHYQLNHAILHCYSSVIEDYIEVLCVNFAEPSKSNNLSASPVSYIDEHFHRALSLPHGFAVFDEVTRHWIEAKMSNVNSDDYKAAMFRRHFYVGIFFENYLRDNPQTEEAHRKFLYGSFLIEENGWIATNFVRIGAAERRLAFTAIKEVNLALTAEIKGEGTPQSYLEKVEYALQQYKTIQMLGYCCVKVLLGSASIPQETQVKAYTLVLQIKNETVTVYWRDTNTKRVNSQAFPSNEVGDIIALLPVPGGESSYDLELRNAILLKYQQAVPEAPISTADDTILLHSTGNIITAYWTENHTLKSSSLSHEVAQEIISSIGQGNNKTLPYLIRVTTLLFGCAPLLNTGLRFLGDDWAYFISVCTWIVALVNRYLFLPEHIDYVHKKIEAILSNKNGYFSKKLLETMRNLWKQYCDLSQISQQAIREWMDQRAFSFASVEKLSDRGDTLFFCVENTTEENVFEKTLWLNMALQFHRGIKDNLGSQRVSLAPTKADIDFIAQNRMTSEELTEITQKRRVYIVKILGIILSNPNLSPSQRKSVRQCTQDIFKNPQIRELTLNKAVERIKKLKKDEDQASINNLLESHILGFVFSSSDCEIFAEKDFVYTVKRLLELSSLAIDVFFARLKAGLECVCELVMGYSPVLSSPFQTSAEPKKHNINVAIESGMIAYQLLDVNGLLVKGQISQSQLGKAIPADETQLPLLTRYILSAVFEQGVDRPQWYDDFLPCLMERLFTAFSVCYRYLTTQLSNASSSLPIPKRTVGLWGDCIEIVSAIANAKGIKHAQQYHRFADAWESIKRSVFKDIQSNELINPIQLKQKPNLSALVLAYDVFLELNKVGFNTDDATTIISQQWNEVTGYKITANEVKALFFILASQKAHLYNEKLSVKIEKLSEFFTHAVTGVMLLGRVLCAEVSPMYLLSSPVSSQILPVKIKKDGQLDHERFSLRRPESLDQITIDLAKRISALWEAGLNPGEYTFLFIYRPSLKTFKNRSSERYVVRSVEVYQEDGKIVRQDCFVRDDRDLTLKCESPWTSFAASMLLTSEQTNVSLKTLVGENSGVNINTRIIPEFFNLVLQQVYSSMQVMERLYAPSLTPISAVFLRPASAVYYDPRALLHCDEEALIGLFVLGLIYTEIQQQESQKPGASLWWLHYLPYFFADPHSGQSNVKNLARVGIVNSGILRKCYGSSGEHDPVEKALRMLDEKMNEKWHEELEPLRQIRKDRQRAYCQWFNDSYSQKKTQALSVRASDSSLRSSVILSSGSNEDNEGTEIDSYSPSRYRQDF